MMIIGKFGASIIDFFKTSFHVEICIFSDSYHQDNIIPSGWGLLKVIGSTAILNQRPRDMAVRQPKVSSFDSVWHLNQWLPDGLSHLKQSRIDASFQNIYISPRKLKFCKKNVIWSQFFRWSSSKKLGGHIYTCFSLRYVSKLVCVYSRNVFSTVYTHQFMPESTGKISMYMTTQLFRWWSSKKLGNRKVIWYG